MPIIRLNELPEGSGNLTNDDIFVFMDSPGGTGVTKKISFSQIVNAIGGGGGNPFDQDLNTFNSPSFSGVTVSGSQIIGGGSNSGDGNGYGTIELIPDSGLYSNDQYIIIDPTAPNHIHLRAGGTIDNSLAELIIGGENSNVKIGAGTNAQISIKTTGYSTVEFIGQIDNGFGDGPGATLHVTSIISGTITDGMTIYGEGLPTEGWVLQFGTVMAPQGDGGTGNYYLPGANYLIGSQIFNNNDSPNNTWTFGNNGILTFPDDSTQNTSAQNVVNDALQNQIVAGTGISLSYDTITDSLTITSTGSGVLADQASSIVTTVFNETGSPIPKMTAVYIDGGHGDRPTVSLALATGDPTSAGTYGVTLENIDNMELGKVIVFGALTGVNTDPAHGGIAGATEGSTLYLSPTTPGGLTTTKPSAPNHIVVIGTVVRVHQNEGVIEVRIQNGFELEELHNVAISGVADGQYLKYNGATKLWVPGTVSTGVTVANNSDNRVLTCTSSSTSINGEANLTFNGTTLSVSGAIDVDNLRLDANTISSINTDGSISISPNGLGQVALLSNVIRVGDPNVLATITTNGTGNLVLNTNAGTNSGSITIAQGINGNITIAPNGTGDVYVDADTLRVGDSNSAATITSNGTGNLTISTNSGTNSGSIVINQGVDGNIGITPNGTGEVDLSKVDIDGGSIDNTIIGATSAASGKFTQLYPTVVSNGTVSGSVSTNVANGQIFDMTVSGATTLSLPTNPVDGVTIRWRITQDGTGGHSVSLHADFVIPSSASSPLPWSTAANATDILAATYHAGRAKWDVVAFVPGY